MYKVVHKPWGKEEWLELNDAYCYKRIYINAGYKTSYQYHKFKKETNYIIEGKAEIWLEDDKGTVNKKIMKAGDFFNVIPPRKHRVIAISDIILQEVSTPEVDDVYRINDEFNRKDGKIEAEHNTPAVLILSAGVGSRLSKLTDHVNKALLTINNEAIISIIIDKFPKDYDFIITLGYKGDELREFLELRFPKRNFKFISVPNYSNPESGPGKTALMCEEYLRRPFYFIVSDCILDSPIPHLDGNWLGAQETSYPEKYSTMEVDKLDRILDFKQKSQSGHKLAFTGIASIWDHNIFWNELKSNIEKGEIVSAFKNINKYNGFKAKTLRWFDTGNLDDLNLTKKYFNDSPISLEKNTGQISYVGKDFIKFNPNPKTIKNISKRAKKLENLIPENFTSSNHFIKYRWMEGQTLYELGSVDIFSKFLSYFDKLIKGSKTYPTSKENIRKFYIEKTKSRVDSFIEINGQSYLDNCFVVNGVSYNPMAEYIDSIVVDKFKSSKNYDLFHGDLQFDNIVYDQMNKKFYYIDWRESFADNTDGGDIYYDLAKLYGGLIFNYFEIKTKKPFELEKGDLIVNFKVNISDSLSKFKIIYEEWLKKNGFDLKYVKFLTGIIFLNMSPLHDGDFGKVLWFKSLEVLEDANK
jgi:NDP-sugar pyrophosphorylase family protein/mannose-6-phosphate isomerase-like protein (cupin superfamily)